MAGLYPWGQPNTGTTGTLPDAVQGVIWGLYASFGLLDGCELTGNTDMSVHIAAGAGVAEVGTRRAIWYAIPEHDLPLPAAPGTGSRTDTIYARPSDGQVLVAAGGAGVPAGALRIGQVVVPAGATRGNMCSIPADRGWAVPHGGTWLAYDWRSTMAYQEVLPDTHMGQQDVYFGDGSFFVAQDQRLQLTLSVPWRARTAGLHTYLLSVFIDEQLQFSWRVGVDEAGATTTYSERLWVTAGRHTVRLRRRKLSGSGTVENAGGGPDKIMPAWLRIEAAGITS